MRGELQKPWTEEKTPAAGLVIGDLGLFALAVAGLAALAAALGSLFFIIEWIGIAYLLFLAYQLWTERPKPIATPPTSGDGWRLICLGAMLPLGNPKAIVFYVALLPAVLDPTSLSWSGCAELALVIAVIWTAVLYAYAYAGDRAAQMIKTARAQKFLNGCASGAMVGAAGTIAAQR